MSSVPATGVRSIACFERITQIGEGTYGEVYKGRDRVTGEIVALKKLRVLKDCDDFSRTTVRELKLLRSLFHDNLVLLKEVVAATEADGKANPEDKPGSTYLVFEYLQYDLAGLVESGMRFSYDHIRWYAWQLLKGIEFMHANHFVHRDLKCANLLLDDQHTLKLADFGLSRILDQRKPERTNKVITLWYRPPELLLGETRYGFAVDMWSIGCIITELFRRKPLFAADTEAEMLDRIFHVIGTPTPATWPGYTVLAKACHVTLPTKTHESTLDRVFAAAGVPYQAQRLLKGLLSLDPEKRPTASEALKSPMFTDCAGIGTRLPPVSSEIDASMDHHEYMARQRRKQNRDTQTVTKPSIAPKTTTTATTVTNATTVTTATEVTMKVSESVVTVQQQQQSSAALLPLPSQHTHLQTQPHAHSQPPLLVSPTSLLPPIAMSTGFVNPYALPVPNSGTQYLMTTGQYSADGRQVYMLPPVIPTYTDYQQSQPQSGNVKPFVLGVGNGGGNDDGGGRGGSVDVAVPSNSVVVEEVGGYGGVRESRESRDDVVRGRRRDRSVSASPTRRDDRDSRDKGGDRTRYHSTGVTSSSRREHSRSDHCQHRSRSRSRSQSGERDRERDRDRGRDRDRDRDRDRGRHKSRDDDRERHSSHGHGRHRDSDRHRHDSKSYRDRRERSYSRSRSKTKSKSKSRSRSRDRRYHTKRDRDDSSYDRRRRSDRDDRDKSRDDSRSGRGKDRR